MIQSLSRLMLAVTAAASLIGAPLSAQPSQKEANLAQPKIVMQETLDKVVDTAVNLRGDEHKEERRAELRKIISPKFDFREMAMRALGTHWRQVTPEEQNEFVDVFSNLLARTYLERIETVQRNMVKIDGETVEYPKAIVRTSVNSEGNVFPINYKLLVRDDGWKVYDVIIENIGLVANYRNEFAGIIRREKFSGLMKRLREKSLS